MLLLLEIILTTVAWRKGWGARALIPGGCALGFGFLLGMIIGASGGSLEDAFVIGVAADLSCVIALLAMTTRAPKANEETAVPIMLPEVSRETPAPSKEVLEQIGR